MGIPTLATRSRPPASPRETRNAQTAMMKPAPRTMGRGRRTNASKVCRTSTEPPLGNVPVTSMPRYPAIQEMSTR